MKKMNQFKIFLVDDDIFYSTIFCKKLNNLSLSDVTRFSSGNECVNSLHIKPDVIFLDYNMEGMNGFEVLKKIKRINPNIYVVMLSSQNDIEITQKSLKHGAFDFLQKSDDYLEKITEVLKEIEQANKTLVKKKKTLFQKILSFYKPRFNLLAMNIH